MFKKEKVSEDGFHWLQVDKKHRRPTRDLPLKIKRENGEEIMIAPGTVGGLFDKKSTLEGNSWVGNGVVVTRSSIKENSYIEGTVEIRNSELRNKTYVKSGGQISGSKLNGPEIKTDDLFLMMSTVGKNVFINGSPKIDCSLIFGETTIEGKANIKSTTLSGKVYVGNKANLHHVELKGDIRLGEGSTVDKVYGIDESYEYV